MDKSKFITLQNLNNKNVTLVVDKMTSWAIEINVDTKKTFEEASGTAIYSNSELTVSSCFSIFETLWIQSELNKQNKIKEAYFQIPYALSEIESLVQLIKSDIERYFMS